MNTFIILLAIIFLIIALEKPKLLADIYYNLGTLSGIIKNLLFIIPLLAIFFNVDDLGEWISKRNIDANPNITQKTKWWNDPTQRKKYKKKQLRKVSESTKKIVASNQNWRCLMCHNLLDYSYEIDHNVPLFAGGTNHISNLHALCRNCHGKKTILERNENFY